VIWTDGAEDRVSGLYLNNSGGVLADPSVFDGSTGGGDQYLPRVVSGTDNFLVVWTYGNEVRGGICIPPPPRPALSPIAPTDWKMVLSLKPTFTWMSADNVERYRLKIYYAMLDQEFQVVRGGLRRSLEIPVNELDCEARTGQVCFKLHAANELSTGARIEESGYFWEVEAVDSAGQTISQGAEGYFQIPPLGLQPGNLYWNAYDDLIYKWSEERDLPPALVKAVFGVEGHRIAAWGGGLPPTRSYLYESAHDYEYFNAPDCADFPDNFNCPGFQTQVISQYYPTQFLLTAENFVWNGPYPFDHDSLFESQLWTIARLASDPLAKTFSHDNSLIGNPRLNCQPVTNPECKAQWNLRANPNRSIPAIAQYRLVASYGLGQLFYFAGPWQFKDDNRQQLTPEALYDANTNIKFATKRLGDVRCAWQKSTNNTSGSYIGAGDNTDADFPQWIRPLGAYNGSGFNKNAEAGAMSYAGSISRFFITTKSDDAHRNTQPVNLSPNSVPEVQIEASPGQTYNKKPCPLPATASAADDPAIAGLSSSDTQIGSESEVEVASQLVNLKGPGNPLVFVTLSTLDELESIENTGVIRVFNDETGQTLAWQSPPIENITGVVATRIIPNPAIGRQMLQTDWFAGAHSSRTYFLQWDGSAYNLIPIFDKDGALQDGVLSNGGGVFVLPDGSLATRQRGDQAFDQTVVNLYLYHDTGYQEVRSYLIDQTIIDTVLPQTMVNIVPAPSSSGWNTVPVSNYLKTQEFM